MTTYLSNAFSLNMLPRHGTLQIWRYPLASPAHAVAELYGDEPEEHWVSVVGHEDTAAVFASELGIEVACNRATVELRPGDRMIVGQYRGPRLPPGATALPSWAAIDWVEIEVSEEPV